MRKDRAKLNAAVQKLTERVAQIESRLEVLERAAGGKPARKSPARGSITTLLQRLVEEGFFDVPRTATVIREKLAARGHPYPRTSLTNPLLRAVRNHLLDRVKADGVWRYSSRRTTKTPSKG